MTRSPRRLLLLPLLLAVCVGCDTTESSTPDPPEKVCEPADRPLICGRQLNIAHRGGARLAPENTLVAFEHAAMIGVDALELDVHATSEGVVVVMHDEDVDRTTDGTGRIKDMTFDELRMLDAGYHFSPDGGATFPHRGQGVTVPTLQEVLDAFPSFPVAIEIKQATPRIQDAVYDVIADQDAVNRTQIASFFDDVLIELRAAHPDMFTSLGAAELTEFFTLAIEDADSYVPPARVIQAPHAMVTDDYMAKADRVGMTVHAWTVNDPELMQMLLDRNVHAVMTDDPAALEELVP